MQFKILQFKDIKTIDYAFMDYDYAKKHGFTLKDYEVVYGGTISASAYKNIFELLESLFTKFNVDRPEDFKGHSMSVSDVIQLEDDRFYYVDMIAFQPIR